MNANNFERLVKLYSIEMEKILRFWKFQPRKLTNIEIQNPVRSFFQGVLLMSIGLIESVTL